MASGKESVVKVTNSEEKKKALDANPLLEQNEFYATN